MNITNENTKSFLGEKEWILFQINEGPCQQACPFCYEKPFTIKRLNEARDEGKIFLPDSQSLQNMQTKELAILARKYKYELGFEMSLEELDKYFKLLKNSGLDRAGLTGSQPSGHSYFAEILNLAKANELFLRVYSADYMVDKLKHPAVKNIVLNVEHQRKFFGSDYMKNIVELIDQGKDIHLRVNFESPELVEKKLIFDFYDQLDENYREKVLLKYSFTVKVNGQNNLVYATPSSLKENRQTLLNFIDEFKNNYPTTEMYTERPIFPCSFPREIWEEYKNKGGFITKCDSEFTIYSGGYLNFCPPGRMLTAHKKIDNSEQLVNRITELRHIEKQLSKTPSFDECNKCPVENEIYCQGGCLGYKVGLL